MADDDWVIDSIEGMRPVLFRQYEDPVQLFISLYYQQVIKTQSWTSGYLLPESIQWIDMPITNADELPTWLAVAIYPPHAPTTAWRISELVRTVYGLAVNGYYLVTLTREMLHVDERGVVRLVEFTGILRLDDPGHFVATDQTADWARGYTLADDHPQGKLDRYNYTTHPLCRPAIRKRALTVVRETLERTLGTSVEWGDYSTSEFPWTDCEPIEQFIKRREKRLPRYIGRGGSGIIYRPPWPTTTTRDQQYVGKVFSNQDFYQRELRQAQLIQRYDPEGRFHARLISADPLTPRLNQLTYEYVGYPIYQLKLSYSARAKFYRSLLALFDGLLTLCRSRVVHGDVSVNNLLMDGDLHCRLIDYGLSCRFEDLDWEFLQAHRYLYFPFDVSLGSTKPDPGRPIRRFIAYAAESRTFITRWVRVMGLTLDESVAVLRRHCERLAKWPLIERRQWLAERLDFHGLGISLLTLACWHELQGVIRHLIAPDIMVRDPELARQELVRVIEAVSQS